MINIPKLLLSMAPYAVLGIILIGLKLCGAIDWSWWWVALPLCLVIYTLIFDIFWFWVVPKIYRIGRFNKK